MVAQERGFQELDCYKLAVQVLKEAYRLARRLPKVERYNMADQVRRAATSVTLNIAEGYGRYHYLDRLRFFYIARGSLMETLSIFVSCEAVGYIDQPELTRLQELAENGLRTLNGYIRHIRNRQEGKKEYGETLIHEEGFLYAALPDRPEIDESA